MTELGIAILRAMAKIKEGSSREVIASGIHSTPAAVGSALKYLMKGGYLEMVRRGKYEDYKLPLDLRLDERSLQRSSCSS